MVEEVQLIDYLRVMWKRRWLIVSGPLICMIAAGLVSLRLPKVYETSLYLDVGKTWGMQVEDPYKVVELINSTPFIAKVKQVTNWPESVEQMAARRRITAETIQGEGGPSGKKAILVKVLTRGDTPQQTVGIANAVADLVIQDHKALFDEQMREYSRYETELGNQIKAMEKDLHDLDMILKRQRANPTVNAPAVILLQAQLEQKQSQLLNFMKELRDVKIANNSKTRTENTRVVLPAVLPERPVGPKATLNVAVAGMIGLCAALVAAFFLEYLDRVKRREQGQGNSGSQTDKAPEV
jgi:capsular polysaccharide biosynthesis protein